MPIDKASFTDNACGLHTIDGVSKSPTPTACTYDPLDPPQQSIGFQTH